MEGLILLRVRRLIGRVGVALVWLPRRHGRVAEPVPRELVRRSEDLSLIDGVPSALKSLQDDGFALIVVTNQSAIARGTLSEDELKSVHDCLTERLASEGVSLDGIFYCPHHPTEGAPPLKCVCECRKPAPGMIQDAAKMHDLDLARSWMVGDNISDIRAAESAGIQSLLVLTGKGQRFADQLPSSRVTEDLSAAAQKILSER